MAALTNGGGLQATTLPYLHLADAFGGHCSLKGCLIRCFQGQMRSPLHKVELWGEVAWPLWLMVVACCYSWLQQHGQYL